MIGGVADALPGIISAIKGPTQPTVSASAPAPSQTGQIDPNAVNPNAPVKREIEYDHEFLTGLVARGSKSNGKSGSRRRVRRHSPTT